VTLVLISVIPVASQTLINQSMDDIPIRVTANPQRPNARVLTPRSIAPFLTSSNLHPSSFLLSRPDPHLIPSQPSRPSQHTTHDPESVRSIDEIHTKEMQNQAPKHIIRKRPTPTSNIDVSKTQVNSPLSSITTPLRKGVKEEELAKRGYPESEKKDLTAHATRP